MSKEDLRMLMDSFYTPINTDNNYSDLVAMLMDLKNESDDK